MVLPVCFRRRDRNAAHVLLLVRLAVAPDLQMQRLGKKVDAGNADAVQSAGNLVSVRIKLAAGVQLGHHDFRRRLFLFLHLVDRNAAAVVDDRDRVVEMDRHFDRVAISGQRFVDRIVDDFVNQVVKTDLAGRTDVHRRALAHRFAPFQNCDRR